MTKLDKLAATLESALFAAENGLPAKELISQAASLVEEMKEEAGKGVWVEDFSPLSRDWFYVQGNTIKGMLNFHDGAYICITETIVVGEDTLDQAQRWVEGQVKGK